MSDSNQKKDENDPKQVVEPTKSSRTSSPEKKAKKNAQIAFKKEGGKLLQNNDQDSLNKSVLKKTDSAKTITSEQSVPSDAKKSPPVIEQPVSYEAKTNLSKTKLPFSIANKTPQSTDDVKKSASKTASLCICPPKTDKSPKKEEVVKKEEIKEVIIENKKEEKKEEKKDETKEEKKEEKKEENKDEKKEEEAETDESEKELYATLCMKPVPKRCLTCALRRQGYSGCRCTTLQCSPSQINCCPYRVPQVACSHYQNNACMQTDPIQRTAVYNTCCDSPRTRIALAKISKEEHIKANQNYEAATEAAQNAREEKLRKAIKDYQDCLDREKKERALQAKKSKEELGKKAAEEKEMRQKSNKQGQAIAEQEKEKREKREALRKRREEEWKMRLESRAMEECGPPPPPKEEMKKKGSQTSSKEEKKRRESPPSPKGDKKKKESPPPSPKGEKKRKISPPPSPKGDKKKKESPPSPKEVKKKKESPPPSPKKK